MEKCICGSHIDYTTCCEPFHRKMKNAQTAEELMRSRFAAFAKGEVDYLVATTHPAVRHLHQPNEIESWANDNQWLKLEIISATANKVHFKAYYQDKQGGVYEHEELSTFDKVAEQWYYVDGEYDF